jgi:hypothetical protein
MIHRFFWKGSLAAAFTLLAFLASAQATYQYSLKSDFHGQPAPAPDLIQIPNNSSLTGAFVARTVPASTCGTQGTAHGYFFEDDSGLQFNNPSGFINQSYSIAFNFQIDEFISPPAWVRIMSFTHTDDVGIYIKLTDPPDHGTLEFWPYGTVGTDNFFSPVDFYQLILVRNDAASIKIFVNGNLFATYDDSESQKYVPQAPNSYIIWFRDDPSVLAGEASPGFVSDIRIANFAWSDDQVQQAWAAFCSSLLSVQQADKGQWRVYPDPAGDQVTVEIPSGIGPCTVTLLSLQGQELMRRDGVTDRAVFGLEAARPGCYFIRVQSGNGVRVLRFTRL